jgi:hypothetical protein
LTKLRFFDSIVEEVNMRIYINILFFLFLPFFLYSQDFPSVRYVNSRNGLNQREAPSSSSRKIGTLLYGFRVIAYERSNKTETIDGITDYWYNCQYGGSFWLFGGYLSENIPDNVEPILGYWNTDKGDRHYWSFQPDRIARHGIKETSRFWVGTWTLSEYNGELPVRLSFATGNIYKLTIITSPTEFISDFNSGESQTFVYYVHIINKNRIYLQYENGNGEFLDRNNGII